MMHEHAIHMRNLCVLMHAVIRHSLQQCCSTSGVCWEDMRFAAGIEISTPYPLHWTLAVTHNLYVKF